MRTVTLDILRNTPISTWQTHEQREELPAQRQPARKKTPRRLVSNKHQKRITKKNLKTGKVIVTVFVSDSENPNFDPNAKIILILSKCHSDNTKKRRYPQSEQRPIESVQ